LDEAASQFGRRVKQLRRAKHLTQAQVAERLDMSINYISQIETGEASPSFETIVKLAKGLEVPIRELFDFEALDKD
jgi:transcriptional regulator with XRE-family HTH domain